MLKVTLFMLKVALVAQAHVCAQTPMVSSPAGWLI